MFESRYRPYTPGRRECMCGIGGRRPGHYTEKQKELFANINMPWRRQHELQLTDYQLDALTIWRGGDPYAAPLSQTDYYSYT